MACWGLLPPLHHCHHLHWDGPDETLSDTHAHVRQKCWLDTDRKTLQYVNTQSNKGHIIQSQEDKQTHWLQSARR